MPRRRSASRTPLSEWLDQHQRLISRADFAEQLGIRRENLDRLCRGDRRPGLGLAFSIEELTARLTEGWDVLAARTWCADPSGTAARHGS